MDAHSYIEEHREEILEEVRAKAKASGWKDGMAYVIITGAEGTEFTFEVSLCPDEVKVWDVGPT